MTRHTPLWIQAGDYAASADRRLISSIWRRTAVDDLDFARVPGTMNAIIGPGRAVLALGGGAVLCISDANENLTFAPAPAAPNNRLDRVFVQARAADLGIGGGEDFIFGVATGTPSSGADIAGPLPPGALWLWDVRVKGGSASLDDADIDDLRPPGGQLALAPQNFKGQLPSTGISTPDLRYDMFWYGLSGDLTIGWPTLPAGYLRGSRVLMRIYGHSSHKVTFSHMWISTSAAQLPATAYSNGWGSTLVGFIYDDSRLPGGGWPNGTFLCVAVTQYGNP